MGDLGMPVPADDDDAAPDDDDAGPAPYACTYSVTSDDIPEAPDRDGGDHECHNGTIDKEMLRGLVGDGYLEAHPPNIGDGVRGVDRQRTLLRWANRVDYALSGVSAVY